MLQRISVVYVDSKFEYLDSMGGYLDIIGDIWILLVISGYYE